jgi:hypothetical protein
MNYGGRIVSGVKNLITSNDIIEMDKKKEKRHQQKNGLQLKME